MDENVETPEVETTEVEAPAETEEVATQEETPEEEPSGVENQEPAAPEVPNYIWAAARRRAEMEARTKEDREYAARFGNFTNPKTGQKIRSKADYFAALDAKAEAEARAQQEQAMQIAGQLPAEQAHVMQRAIQLNNQQMESRLNALQGQLAERQQAEEQARIAESIQDDIAQIAKYEPKVKSFQDLASTDAGREAIQLSMNTPGLDLLTAYQKVTYDKRTQQGVEAGKQAARNELRGKSHLDSVGGGHGAGNKNVPIPSAQLEDYRTMFPGKSDEALRELYNRALLN